MKPSYLTEAESKLTTLVLGAGTSHELGYPLGEGLIDQILDYATNNIQTSHPEAQALKFSIEAARPRSIDERIRDKPALASFCKKAIVHKLLETESVLKPKANQSKFYQHIIETVKAAGLDVAQHFRILTFNYDRSFEIFRDSYLNETVSDSDFRARLTNILEPHHIFGRLPDTKKPLTTSDFSVEPFSFIDLDPIKQRQIVDQNFQRIKTIPEVTGYPDEHAASTIFSSKRIYLIGMAYHEANMRILGLNNPDMLPAKRNEQIFASCFKLGRAVWNDLSRRYYFNGRGDNDYESRSQCKAQDFFSEIATLRIG